MVALPDWLTPLPDAEQMHAIDRWAIEVRGVPALDLMESAGAAVARAVERLAPDGPVTVVCGKGNNGGDGLVAARLLREAGRPVTVVCVAPPQELSGDARTNLERLPGEGPLRPSGEPWTEAGAAPTASGAAGRRDVFAGGAAIVDALLGTGFHGEPHGAVAESIEAINKEGAPVISVDVPSGVDASTGVVAGPAVRASLTVTFHAAKPGLWINPGKAYVGRLEVVDIGIPRGAPMDATIGLIEPAVLDALPRRRASWTKFKSGHVLVAGGSRGLTGAPVLAANAAMRTGAGYVTCCAPASQQPVLATHLLEVMTRALPEDDGAHIVSGADEVLAASKRGGAVIVGPGLGRTPGALEFARIVVRRSGVPVLLDADGLNAHAERLRDLREAAAPLVLTPHEGELGRLLGCPSEEVKAHRLASARRAAAESNAIVVLKGDDTIVARPDGFAAISPGATPALATAGTGDVLSGVTGALLAKEMDPFVAACAGVRLHALAGKLAAERLRGPDGVVASDVIAALPLALGG